MNLRHDRSAGLVIVAALGALVVGPTVHAAAAAPSPASGHAEVIAQGLVTFADGPAHWTLTVDAVTETVSSIPSAAPAFLLSDGPAAVVVADSTGPLARLAPGEAHVPAGRRTDRPVHGAGEHRPDQRDRRSLAGSGPDEFTPGSRRPRRRPRPRRGGHERGPHPERRRVRLRGRHARVRWSPVRRRSPPARPSPSPATSP